MEAGSREPEAGWVEAGSRAPKPDVGSRKRAPEAGNRTSEADEVAAGPVIFGGLRGDSRTSNRSRGVKAGGERDETPCGPLSGASCRTTACSRPIEREPEPCPVDTGCTTTGFLNRSNDGRTEGGGDVEKEMKSKSPCRKTGRPGRTA
jgi:hypothetical protein